MSIFFLKLYFTVNLNVLNCIWTMYTYTCARASILTPIEHHTRMDRVGLYSRVIFFNSSYVINNLIILYRPICNISLIRRIRIGSCQQLVSAHVPDTTVLSTFCFVYVHIVQLRIKKGTVSYCVKPVARKIIYCQRHRITG